MELRHLFLADEIVPLERGRFRIDGFFDRLQASFLPATKALMYAFVGIVADESDNGRSCPFSFRLLSPAGRAVLTMSATLTADRIPRGEFALHPIIQKIENIRLTESGTYMASVRLGDAKTTFPALIVTNSIVRCESRSLPNGETIEFCFDEALLAVPLFKYLERGHAVAMLERGEVKIGTPSPFRRESGKSARGDDGEFRRVLHGRFPDGPLTSSTPLPDFFHGTIGVPADGSDVKVTIRDSYLIKHDDAPDAYMYSTAWQFSKSAMNQLGGACVRIDNPKRFFELITDELAPFIQRQAVVCRVSYEPRSGDYRHVRTELSPALVKPPTPEYTEQLEARGVWLGRQPLDDFVILRIDAIREIISPYVIPEEDSVS